MSNFIMTESGSDFLSDENKQRTEALSMNLGSQIKEDHLTCSICLNGFTKPKALPCLHTFCELCIHDYVVGRGFESVGIFPCPLCRIDTTMPTLGIKAFPDNHLVASLSDTVDKLQPPRPVPKPRRSLGQPCDDRNMSEPDVKTLENIKTECSPGPDDFEIVDKKDDISKSDDYQETLPPPYSSVADSHPDRDHAHRKLCSNDTDQGWMIVPGQIGTQIGPREALHHVSGDSTSHHVLHPENGRPMQNPNCTQNSNQIGLSHGASGYSNPVGWNLNPFGPAAFGDHDQVPDERSRSSYQPNPNRNVNPGLNSSRGQENYPSSAPLYPSSAPLYPSVPMDVSLETACTENLMLRFGKQGSTPRDFIKPIGLAVSKEGNYIISDNGGSQNRLLVFNSGGEITTAFKCGCKVKDIALTENNEIIAAIHKTNSGIRRFTLNGQLKGEYGKFFTYEEPCGIAELRNRGVVLTGIANHCGYILTDQMKLQTKFGRKGNGDGYFSHPGFVDVDSKNHIIVSDKVNGCIQVFNSEGKFKHRFGTIGQNHGSFQMPMGVCVDSADNIIVADSGNFRVDVFSPKGRYLSSVVRDTWQLGEDVKPVNVSVTPTGKIAILLRGPYFAEVRIYSSGHQDIPQQEGPNVGGVPLPVSFGAAVSIPKNLGIWPSK